MYTKVLIFSIKKKEFIDQSAIGLFKKKSFHNSIIQKNGISSLPPPHPPPQKKSMMSYSLPFMRTLMQWHSQGLHIRGVLNNY